MTALRVCRDCKVEAHTEEELDLFVKRHNLPHGRNTICKNCSSIRQKKNRDNDGYRLNRKRYGVHINYNITLEEYDECMSTSNKCQICSTNKDLVYDHDHDTMEFRGVLCRRCNSALGYLGDSLEGVTKAFIYLGGVPSKL